MGFQDFSFKKSQYERPTQDWVCGWAQEGWTCPIGPRGDGTCRAKYECYPIQKQDRWFCTRPEHRGGSCQQGPWPDGTCCQIIPKCQPIRSLRQRRGAVSFWTVAATISILCIILPGSNGPAFFSSGDLAHVHGTIAHDCGACHTTSHQNSGNEDYATTSSRPPETDSSLCLNCHQFGDRELAIHNRSPEELKASTTRLQNIDPLPARPVSLWLLDWLPGWSPTSLEPLACGTCHQEHQGKAFDLQTMSNQTCQGCHTVQFTSFSDGHPELHSYPYKRRTRIAFDHHIHFGKHFPEKDTEKRYATCTSCHTLGAGGQIMVTGHFRKTCAECHTQELKGIGLDSGPSLTFFRIPEIDVDTLKIGEWPRGLDGLEQGVTPYMQLLLEATAVNNPQLAAAELAIVAGDFSIIEKHDGGLYDLSDASPTAIEAATRIGWAIKGLLFDFVTTGQKTLITRLSTEQAHTLLGQSLKEQEIALLATQVPTAVIQTAQRQWFSHLRKEIADRKETSEYSSIETDESPKISRLDAHTAQTRDKTSPKNSAVSTTLPASSFYAQDRMNAKFSQLVRFNDTDNRHIILVSSQAQDDESILGEMDESILDVDESSDEGDSILGNEADESLDDMIDINDELESEPQDNDAMSQEEQVIDLEQQQRLDKERESGVVQGGWFLQESDFTIRYRRAGHEDRFFQAWIDATRLRSKAKTPNPASMIFQSLSGRHVSGSADSDVNHPTSSGTTHSLQAGGCLRCHSLDTHENAKGVPSLSINWKSFRPQRTSHTPTHFRHDSHFSLVQDEKGCKACHQLQQNSQEGWTDSWFASSTNPNLFASNFMPITKNSCTSCHQENRAGDGCLLCHNYHLGQFSPALPKSQSSD